MISMMKWLVGFTVFAMVGLVQAPITEAEEQSARWVPVGDVGNAGCFDTRYREIFWHNNGTFLNWRTNQQMGTNGPSGSLLCGPNGWVFSSSHRMKLGMPAPESIAHSVTDYAFDTTQRVYSFLQGEGLWMSDNAGGSWWNRGYRFGTSLSDIAVASADSWIIYALVIEPSTDPNVVNYSIYGSTNTGLIWTKRMSSNITVAAGLTPRLSIRTLPSRKAPVEQLILTIEDCFMNGPFRRPCHYISRDGGRSWASKHQVNMYTSIDFYQTNEGLLRLQTPGKTNSAGETALYSLSLSVDSGVTWQDLATPSNDIHPQGGFGVTGVQLWSHPIASNNLLLQDKQGLWYSNDNGRTWQKIAGLLDFAPNGVVGFGSGLPVSIFRRDNDGSFSVYEP